MEHWREFNWMSFDTYPAQGSDICIHFYSPTFELHKYFYLKGFNAFSFNPRQIIQKYRLNGNWELSWLPIGAID